MSCQGKALMPQELYPAKVCFMQTGVIWVLKKIQINP